jgi:hypothetical protein
MTREPRVSATADDGGATRAGAGPDVKPGSGLSGRRWAGSMRRGGSNSLQVPAQAKGKAGRTRIAERLQGRDKVAPPDFRRFGLKAKTGQN